MSSDYGPLVPSRQRVEVITASLRDVVDALALCQSRHQSPRASMVAEQHLFQALERLSQALGGVPHGDDEIRAPSGWPTAVRVALMDVASDLEALVGNQPGRWGLRDWKEPSRLRWPSFGDLRYRPFSFGPDQLAIAERMRLAVPVLEASRADHSHPAAAPEAPGNDSNLTPPARAIAAAYDLHREGKPVGLKAACARAGVDRANLRKLYPEAVDTIKALSQPDRSPRRGIRDRRTGDIDASDESSEE